MKPKEVRSSLLNFGDPSLATSRIMKPILPTVKRNEAARPSNIYCPLILFGKNATGLEYPLITVLPSEGGSIIIS